MSTPTESVEHYFALASIQDVESYVALFAPDAVVEDDGGTHVGTDQIRAWRTGVPADVAYDVRAVAATAEGSQVATTEISGDFPGSPILLGFVFGFDEAGLIDRLVIAP